MCCSDFVTTPPSSAESFYDSFVRLCGMGDACFPCVFGDTRTCQLRTSISPGICYAVQCRWSPKNNVVCQGSSPGRAGWSGEAFPSYWTGQSASPASRLHGLLRLFKVSFMCACGREKELNQSKSRAQPCCRQIFHHLHYTV